MNKTVLTAILLVLLFSVPVSVCVVKHAEVIEVERRKISPFPAVPSSLGTKRIKRFFKEFESYYNDRIFGRAALLNLSNKIHRAAKADLAPSKCYRGRDNWLFLGNDYDRCVDALTGAWVPSTLQREAQVRFFTSIDNIVRSCGAEFHMLIGPNKSTIYPEYLPPLTFPASKRAITPLVEMLKAEGISVFDSTDHLRNNKDKGLLYYRSDTHWNHLGAKIAFEGFLSESRLAKLPDVVLLPQRPHRGDLVDIGGYKKFPLSKGDKFYPRWKSEGHKPTIDKTVLVLGDSFSSALMYYLEGVFTKVHRVHYGKVAKNNQEVNNVLNYINRMDKKPDVVIWVQVERAFVHFGNT